MAGAQMFRLDNPTRSYDWGSRTAIAGLLGRAPHANPQAELWIGAHPDAPSGIVDGTTDLLSRIRDDPLGMLGRRTRDRFGDRLPYLLKVLAVERPLSLQVHPREKPELLYAVTDLHALCGLRPADESRGLFARLAAAAPDVRTFAQIAHLLDDPGSEAALTKTFAYIVRLAREEVAGAVAALPRGAAATADESLRVAASLASAYPGDPAVLLTPLLRHAVLRPGEALGVEPGTPHTYLSGLAVELSTCVDHTTRAGLTGKPADIEWFLDLLDFSRTPDPVVRGARRESGERVLTTGHEEFELGVVRLAPGTSVRWEPMPRTVLVLDGRIAMSTAGKEIRVRRGEAVFVPADAGEVVIRGDGHVVQATTRV